jgi:predicted enzyme related to lactoylglutathione lyase
MANPFVHVELATTDVAKAKMFYDELFDWKLEDMPVGPAGSYTMIRVGQGTGGGMHKQLMPGAPSAWIPYVLVDDVRAATAKARSLQGRIYRDVTEIPGMGAFSIVGDPTGAVIGLWQAKR